MNSDDFEAYLNKIIRDIKITSITVKYEVNFMDTTLSNCVTDGAIKITKPAIQRQTDTTCYTPYLPIRDARYQES